MATAIQKTFKCLEALARAPGGLTVSEVASIAGFSRPAATRLLEGLTADSIVHRDQRTKRYRLGLRLYEWSNSAVQASTPINIARREFVKLCMEIGRECNFLIMEELDAVILERVEDVDGVPINRPVPGRRYWFQTASGKAIVANSPDATVRSILERSAQLPEDVRPDVDALKAELEEVRALGYAVSVGFRPEGHISVGVPVLGQAGYAVAAIGTFLPATEFEGEPGRLLIGQMRATATRIAHYLGYEAEVTALVS